MSHYLLGFSLLAILVSGCDAPRQRGLSTTDNNVEYVVGYNPATSAMPAVTGTTPPASTVTPTTTTTSNIPAEVAHCTWSSNGTSGFEVPSSKHLGAYSACKHTSENSVYIQLKTPVVDQQLCLIPTYNVNGATIYIGSPSCLNVPSSTTIYKIPMQLNRPGFENFTMNGVMMMKDMALFYPAPFYRYILSVDAYLYCANRADQTGDMSYCQAFDAVGEFVVHLF